MKTVADYQTECLVNWTFGGTLHNTHTGIYHLQWKLLGEIGEFCEKIGKASRDDKLTWENTPAGLSEERREGLIKELGDVAWYVVVLPHEFDSVPTWDIDLIMRSANEMLDTPFRQPPATVILRKGVDLNRCATKYVLDLLDTGGGELAHQGFVASALILVAQLASLIGSDLRTVMETNVSKLKDRREREVITGDGDNR